jgi:hypothetical protein
MSASYYVEGIAKKDEKFEKMKYLLEACEAMQFTPPKEVIEYFRIRGGEYSEHGFYAKLPDDSIIEKTECGINRYIVDLDKIPNDIRKIAFTISW